MGFMDQTGQVKLVRLNPDGSVPMADTADDFSHNVLVAIYRELRESRRLYCENNNQVFEEDLTHAEPTA